MVSLPLHVVVGSPDPPRVVTEGLPFSLAETPVTKWRPTVRVVSRSGDRATTVSASLPSSERPLLSKRLDLDSGELLRAATRQLD
jgi:hypothetical protein